MTKLSKSRRVWLAAVGLVACIALAEVFDTQVGRAFFHLWLHREASWHGMTIAVGPDYGVWRDGDQLMVGRFAPADSSLLADDVLWFAVTSRHAEETFDRWAASCGEHRTLCGYSVTPAGEPDVECIEITGRVPALGEEPLHVRCRVHGRHVEARYAGSREHYAGFHEIIMNVFAH
ncbi:MAG TPA: hypothetical protein VFK04_04600 [Gemmatimonadaceae bacterium]|nr:hypothetical protein [Gemmatimonadaceae bacterium]